MGIKLNAEDLVTRVMEETGLEDFGGRTFEEGLGVFVGSLNNDVDLTEGTAGFFQQQIQQILMNRLEITRLVKDHPEILEEKIEKPVFIVGLPRSGTTVLHTLMALDPTSRYLRNFESAGPVCPPAGLIPKPADPRIQGFHESMEGLFSMAPVLRSINGINFMAHGTAECQNLTAHEFVHMGWSCGSSLFSHGDWVSECCMQAAYHWHKRLLQVMQWKSPNERWVLKAPMHLFGLVDLMETYPDARIVFTHRNPVDAMVSGISMVYHWTKFTTGQENLKAISDWYPGIWSKGLKKALKVIERFNPDHRVDVFHRDLSESPVKTVEKIFKKFGLRFSGGVRKRMQTWLRDHPRSAFGGHGHAHNIAKQTDSGKVGEEFKFYMDRFDL